MSLWEQHGLIEYSDYFKSDWWQDLKFKLIDCNDKASCFVCEKRTQLLLHHVVYGSLYKEKLNRDVYILCYDCHTSVHFWLFKLIKVPLAINSLLFSMRIRRVIYCFKTGKLATGLAWFLIALIIGGYFLLIWVFTVLLKLLLDITQKSFLK